MIKRYKYDFTKAPQIFEHKDGKWCKKSDVEALKAERDRYKEALEFYADRKNWENKWDSSKYPDESNIENDDGETAREALNKELNDV